MLLLHLKHVLLLHFINWARFSQENALSGLCLVLPKKTGEPARLIRPLRAMSVSIILGPPGVILGQKKSNATEPKFVSTGAGQQGVLDVREAVAASMAGPRVSMAPPSRVYSAEN